MKSKHVLITGGNSGIGKVAAIELARKGAVIVTACRPGDKTDQALAEINAVAEATAVNIPVDLASLESVRNLAKTYQDRFDSLEVLINNAGVFPLKLRLTEDGFELQFGVNHLSHFLLSNLLLPLLESSKSARVVTVSSMMHKKAEIDFDSFTGEKKYNSQKAYGQSKLANVLFAVELSKRCPGVTSNVLHPGGVRTGITRDLPWIVRKLIDLMFISPEKGAETTVKLASDESLADISGEYYDQTQLASCSPLASDDELRQRLWRESEALAGLATTSQVA